MMNPVQVMEEIRRRRESERETPGLNVYWVTLSADRLWLVANTSSPDQLPRRAKALAEALRAEGLNLDRGATSLLAVLNRPANPIRDMETLWCFRLIVTLRSACQLVTAAVHADEYPVFPDVLLRATSLDIRLFLDGSIGVLSAATPLGQS